MQKNGKKWGKMQKNWKKWGKIGKNGKKCKKMQKNAENENGRKMFEKINHGNEEKGRN